MILKAYVERSHTGNLRLLFTDMFDFENKQELVNKKTPLLRVFASLLSATSFPNAATMLKLPLDYRKMLREVKIFIDNKFLDGFLDFFIKNDGCSGDCGRCGYCQRVSDAVIKISLGSYMEQVRRVGKLLDQI